MFRRDSFRITLVGFFLLLGMASGVGAFFYFGMVYNLRDRGLSDFDGYLHMGMARLEEEVRSTRVQTLFLAETPPVAGIMRARQSGGVDPVDGLTEAEWIERLDALMRRMIALRDPIHQIRYIGVSDQGREIARVTWTDGQIVTAGPEELQQEGDRPYFKRTLELEGGQIHQTGLELDVEHGLIETSVRPVLRTATPISGETGAIYGIIVIDIDAQGLIDQMNRAIPDEARFFLLDPRRRFLFEEDRLDASLPDPDGIIQLGAYPGAHSSPEAPKTYAGTMRNRDGRNVAVYGREFALGAGHRDNPALAAISIPVTALNETADELRARIVFLALMFSVFGAVLLYVATNRHAKPMIALTEAAREILAGRPLADIDWPQDTDGPARELRDAFIGVISTIRNREARFEETAKRLETLTNGVTDAIIMIDETGVIETINRATLAMFGYGQGELVGQNVTLLMPASFRSKHESYLKRYVETSKQDIFGRSRHLTGLKKDGSHFPIELSVTVTYARGNVRFIGIIKDVSERDVVTRMKAEFVSTVSHELRTPLASMQGSLGLLEAGVGGKQTSQARELIAMANGNCRRLITLINDILDMEKIESGQMRYSFDHLDLSRIAQTAVRECRGLAASAQVGITTTFPDAAPIVLGDADRLVQVISNLLSNAIKFSPRGETVMLAIREVSGAWRLTVTDRGPGIPPQFRDRLFEKFTQADNSIRRRIGGSGLGLSIARSIVKAHMGVIDYRTSDAGTTFYIDLGISSHTPEDIRSETGTPRGRVLICEEDDAAAQILQQLVESLGYASFLCRSAQSACERLKSEWFDIVVADRDGKQDCANALIECIGQTPELNDIPVILLSQAGSERSQCDQQGNASLIRWVGKPLDEEELRRAMQATAVRRGDSSLRVLHVEDEIDQQLVLEKLLNGIAEIDFAATLSEARARIEETAYDVVILDQYLPDGSGVELMEVVKAQKVPPEVMVYSIDHPSREISRSISASMLKTNVDNNELLDRIKALLRSARSQRTP